MLNEESLSIWVMVSIEERDRRSSIKWFMQERNNVIVTKSYQKNDKSYAVFRCLLLSFGGVFFKNKRESCGPVLHNELAFSSDGGFKEKSNPQFIIEYLCISEERARTEEDIDQRTSAHTTSVWGQEKKRSLRGTSNSHNPQLTQTSAQSEAALKVRAGTSTYINHERSHHKKNSNAHKRHSASVL